MNPRNRSARRSLGEEVFNSLRRAVLRGEIEPGQRLVEEKTASRFGASRTPIREAFLKLEKEGLVERRPKGGFIVGRLDLEEMDEIMDLRALLEGHAAARAAARRTEKLLAGLKETLEDYEQALAAGDLERLIQVNTRFHDLLYQASGSRRLTKITADLRDFFYRLRRHILGLEGMAQQSHEDHCRIVAAIAQGDAATAERLNREHINRSRQALAEEVSAGRLQL